MASKTFGWLSMTAVNGSNNTPHKAFWELLDEPS